MIVFLAGAVATCIAVVLANWLGARLQTRAAQRDALQRRLERQRDDTLEQVRLARRLLELQLGSALARRQRQPALANKYDHEAEQLPRSGLRYVGDTAALRAIQRVVEGRAEGTLEILNTMALARLALERQEQRVLRDLPLIEPDTRAVVDLLAVMNRPR